MLGAAKWLLEKEGRLLKNLLTDNPVCGKVVTVWACSFSFELFFWFEQTVRSLWKLSCPTGLHASSDRAFLRRRCGCSSGDADPRLCPCTCTWHLPNHPRHPAQENHVLGLRLCSLRRPNHRPKHNVHPQRRPAG